MGQPLVAYSSKSGAASWSRACYLGHMMPCLGPVVTYLIFVFVRARLGGRRALCIVASAVLCEYRTVGLQPEDVVDLCTAIIFGDVSLLYCLVSCGAR